MNNLEITPLMIAREACRIISKRTGQDIGDIDHSVSCSVAYRASGLGERRVEIEWETGGRINTARTEVEPEMFLKSLDEFAERVLEPILIMVISRR